MLTLVNMVVHPGIFRNSGGTGEGKVLIMGLVSLGVGSVFGEPSCLSGLGGPMVINPAQWFLLKNWLSYVYINLAFSNLVLPTCYVVVCFFYSAT